MVSAKLALLKDNIQEAKNKKPKGKEKPVSKRIDFYEFIPYHSHFNPHTLMTKDGELVQVVKIDSNILGEHCENLDGIHSTVRDAIRNTIASSDLSEKIGFWIHVIRKRTPMENVHSGYDSGFAESFAGYVSEKWEKTASWEYKYHNEIYITMMHDGQVAPLVIDKTQSKLMVFPKYNKKIRNEYLDNLLIKMDNLSATVIQNLSYNCKARRLSLYERPLPLGKGTFSPPVFHSELLEFFGNIFNLRTERHPLPDVNLSVAMQTSILDFGFNSVESVSKYDGSKRYGTMLSLKQYRDMPVETIDRVLQSPIEMVISQSFVMQPNEKTLKHYKAQKELFEMSGDEAALEMFGVNEMLNFDRKGMSDFGEQQISIMVMSDTMDHLEVEVGTFQKIFAEIGLVLVREDIRVEEVFWAQFPGNFEFVRRKDTVAREKVAGFCRLNRFHEGNIKGNHWGDCLTLMPTCFNSPFAFNFHVADNGHTAFFDFNTFDDKAGKILEHFLLTQTQKFKARIVVFDRDRSARLLLSKMEGRYHTLHQLVKGKKDKEEDKTPILALNPFSLKDTKYNKSFLAAWCWLIISPNTSIDDESRSALRESVEELYNLSPQEHNLPSLIAILSRRSPDLAKPMEQWIGRSEFSGLFDYVQDSLDMREGIVGFDLTPAISTPSYLLPLFSYLMHRTIESIDGRPTVIVLNEAWDLLENSFFAPRLESLLEMLRERNVMVLFTGSNIDNCRSASVTKTIMSSCASFIYAPDELPIEYELPELGLNASDAVLLLDMHRQKGDFLLKQLGESVALRAQLKEAEDAIAIFSNDIKSLSAAHGRFASIPKDY